MEIRVIKEEVNIRLDLIIKTHFIDLTRSSINKACEDGRILLNGNIVKNSIKVKLDDLIYLDDSIFSQHKIEPINMNLKVYFEDEYLLVVDKPSGIVTHPSISHHLDSLVSGLLYHSLNLSTLAGNYRPGIVHRLDKDTSGLLVIAKDNNTHALLSQLIQDKKIVKEYNALCYRCFTEQSGKIETFLKKDPGQQIVRVESEGKLAITNFTVLENYKLGAFVKVVLETGRTHQIRAHFKFINHPIVGDPKYGLKNDKFISSQYLHSSRLSFAHPITNEAIDITSPLPPSFIEMKEILSKLEILDE
jgi:23S rRNA pseudouridine1911/1915/1917 synthase